MRILHTADIHFGQNIYQHYERLDEHLHFFSQLRNWIEEHRPDALLMSGDIFDVAQPSAGVWTDFNDQIVDLRRRFPALAIVIVAGNHDSASRIDSHSKVWEIGGVTVVGTPPPLLHSAPEGWEERYIVRLPSGFIIAIPYMSSDRTETMRYLQEYIADKNSDDLPVVMTGHLAAVGSDMEGHDPEIGNLRPVSINLLGEGYDYMALGHIHKAQTLGYAPVFDEDFHTYPSPAARYSGSVLHVSEDENYPHSVSLVDIERHGEKVMIRQLIINQLRHFLTLPNDMPQPFETSKAALSYLKKFLKKNDNVYIRLRFNKNAEIPADFNSSVYTLIEQSGKDIRYNPRMIFVAPEEDCSSIDDLHPKFDVEEIKQMTNPLDFVRKTADAYTGLSIDDLDELFGEVEEEIRRTVEEN
ncbi:MAG: exonuclease SbcCD subunit D [Muribaculaceae bacterium]|nr:exonuclease SbcCD subunit D [Muribaculaceae bacterium]